MIKTNWIAPHELTSIPPLGISGNIDATKLEAKLNTASGALWQWHNPADEKSQKRRMLLESDGRTCQNFFSSATLCGSASGTSVSTSLLRARNP